MPIDEADIAGVLASVTFPWERLRGGRLFVTGGTGFFGTWLLESFVAANRRFGLDATTTVLSRNPGRFLTWHRHLAKDRSLHFLVGDVRTFDFPEEKFTHVIHMATESSTFVDAREPLPRLEAIIDGMRRVLEFTVQCGAHSFLLTSTGGVYGKQPPEVDRVSEDFTGGPSPTAPSPSTAMGEGKRVCELLACLYAQRFGFAAKIARCFAFSGPHLPIDGHYAIGNFIRDVLEGRPVRVKGDGTPVRSYFYAADLTAWLWTILLDGPTNEAFNVGSEDAISIADLARRVAAQAPDSLPVVIEQNAIPGRPPERYVPSTEKARRVLGLQQTISLDEGVQRMLTWHRKRLDLAP